MTRERLQAPRRRIGQVVAVVIAGTLVLATGFGMLTTAGTLVARSVYIDGAMPPLRELAERSLVYAEDGKTVIGVLGVKDRESVRLQDVPRRLVRAILAVEDTTFFDNPGIDVAAIVRAAVRNVDAGQVRQGGSTITQQLVKNRILEPRRNLRRKLTEISLALLMNEHYTKRRILTEYLNTVYFGNGAYGLKAAIERTFLVVDAPGAEPRPKHMDELTLADEALLAGLIASPERYNPFTAPDLARARRAEVLTRLVEEGIADPEEARAAGAAPIPTLRPTAIDLRPRTHFVAAVQRALLDDEHLGATPDERRRRLLRGGLRVVTTLNLEAQRDAEDAVAEQLPNQPPFTAAMVVVDATSGAIRALVGGPSFERSQYDLATQAPGRQAGSTYKIFTLAAALEQGYSPNDLVSGTSPCTATHPPLPAWETNNIEPGGGIVTLRDATRLSVNCAFAHLIAAIGPEAVVDMAHRLGVDQPIPAYLSITLGTSNTTPLEMATAAATLANGGVRHDPYLVERVETTSGEVLLQHERSGRLVIDPQIAACTVDVLHDAVVRGTGTAAAIPRVDVAGKTGTTDDKADAWFVGFTSELAAAVWMGAPQAHIPMTRVGGMTVFGGTYPARIWRAFADRWTTVRTPPKAFRAPGPVCDRAGAFVTDTGRRAIPRPPIVVEPNPTDVPSVPSDVPPVTAARDR